MFELDPRWSLPSFVPDNPLVWLIEVDGFLLDARMRHGTSKKRRSTEA